MMNRFWKFSESSNESWRDWKWQFRNRLDNRSNLKDFFPNASGESQFVFERYREKYRLGLTPYVLSLIEYARDLNPLQHDPIWQQVRFYTPEERIQPSDYDGKAVNWELPEEMPTYMLHHKYPDRAILRVTDSCHGYCSYCYLTGRTLDRHAQAKQVENWSDVWHRSLNYIRRHPGIRDILVSGGDPLLLDNDRVERILADISEIGSVKSIRLNTRALTFNPYRIDAEIVRVFKKQRMMRIPEDVVHPFRSMPSTHSGACRPLIPGMPSTHSGHAVHLIGAGNDAG